MELNERIKKYYDESQTLYDTFWMNKQNLGMHYGLWYENTKNLNEAIINTNIKVAERLEVKDSDIILDAGCGVGGTSIWLAKNYGVTVIGITISEKQVLLAKKYAKENNVDNLTDFYTKDFCNTGFSDNSFTKIFGIESICHAIRKEEFISEAYRILKPKGRLVVIDGFLNKTNLNEEELRIYQEWLDGWYIPNLSNINDFREKLKTLGFRDIEFEEYTKEVIPSSKRIYLRGILLYPVMKMLNLLKVVSEIKAEYAKSSIIQYRIINNKIGIYGVFSAQK